MDTGTQPDAGIVFDAEPLDDGGSRPDAGPPPDTGPDVMDAGEPEPLQLRVVTFNSGTGANPPLTQNGYTDEEAAISDEHYGNGLAWVEAIEDLRIFLESVDADVVVFQEIFHSEDCPMIPMDARAGFVCETWAAGDPTVAQTAVGPGWQIACHLGKNDKCAAVRRSFGQFVGCSSDLCLDGLDGAQVPSCGGGSRIGRGRIQLTNGSTITVVNVHGTSGLTGSDRSCREQQFEQVFLDLGDGSGLPAASGGQSVVLGDFNTDPGRHTTFDSSARRLNDFVGGASPFQFVSPVGDQAPPSYAGLFNIDHVISDGFVGECWIAGVSPNHPDITSIVIFDHKPLVCDLIAR